MLGWRASISSKDDGNNWIPGRGNNYIRWRDKLYEVKIIWLGHGPEPGDFCVEEDQAADFNGAEDEKIVIPVEMDWL